MGWLELLSAAFLITLPFGAWRATTRRLSPAWFLAIHVPIPLILLIRMESGYNWHYIPFTVAGCVTGQLLGARLFSAWRTTRQHKRLQPAPARVPSHPLGRSEKIEGGEGGLG
jgi:hypothetical protein